MWRVGYVYVGRSVLVCGGVGCVYWGRFVLVCGRGMLVVGVKKGCGSIGLRGFGSVLVVRGWGNHCLVYRRGWSVCDC